ncbi:hypothetical protein D3C76_1414260 [compost metagenome]
MLEVVVDTFFFAKPLQQVQVCFLVLNAKRSHRVLADGQFEAIAVGGQSIFLQQPVQDHGHAQVLENAAAMLIQRFQAGDQLQFVGDLEGATVFETGTAQNAMNALTWA